MNDHVMIKKIDNGFVIEACCADEQEALFVKNLSKAPTVLARMFKISKEDRKSIMENTKVEESEETAKDGKVSLKIKMTR